MATGTRTGNNPSAVEYRVLVGMNYGPTGKRAEPGDVVTDLPPDDIGWLTEQEAIRKVADEVAPEPEPVAVEDPLLVDVTPDTALADAGDLSTPATPGDAHDVDLEG